MMKMKKFYRMQSTPELLQAWEMQESPMGFASMPA
jgi:hypothetical protein